MIRSVLRELRVLGMLGLLMVLLVASGRDAEKLGDNIQIGLPLAALGCAALDGRAVQYFGRYLILETAIKGSKYGLGDAAINQRPSGGYRGFPSGHTAASVFGATALTTTCLKQSHTAQALAVFAAGFVGASRIDAGKHTIWQVLAGAVLGWAVQILALRRFDALFARGVGALGRQLRRLPFLPGRAAVAQFMKNAGGMAMAIVNGFKPLGVALIGMILMFSSVAARSEVTVSVYSGWQTAPHSTVSGNDPAGVGAFSFQAGWEGDSFAAPPHYGLRATWWQSDRFGFTADFNHTKVYADAQTLAASGFQVLEFSDGLNNLTVGVMTRFPQFAHNWTPYAGLSAGVVIPHVEVQTTGAAPRTFEYQVAGPSVAWVLGVSYPLNDRFDLFGEYKGTYSQLKADLVGGGSLNSDILTNALNFGLSYTF